jgi:RNA polymerase sigma-70 factor (ECF subfamily)
VVDAFLAASRGGDFEALLAVLDPDVVLRADAGTASADSSGPAVSKLVRGALAVVEQALTFTKLAPYSRPALINGLPGVATIVGDTLMGVMDVTVHNGRITEINILADPTRLEHLAISA